MSGTISCEPGSAVLLTGGAGFVGSHVAVELLATGYRPVILDNLCNSRASTVDRIGRIAGATVPFVQGDIRDGAQLRKMMIEHDIRAVIHLAALKSIGASIRMPLEYWDNNVVGSIRLLEAMRDCGVHALVFSGSTAVHGEPRQLPVTESHPFGPATPYGRTKLAIERLLRDVADSDDRWRICTLRYFNPVGAHESGLIGEDPDSIPDNLMPLVLQAAAGVLPELQIWGNDYPTPDGTGVRDFIHVMDLAAGHVAALRNLDSMSCEAINLGTGKGCSVLELVHTFERVNGVRVPHAFRPRR
ncbi:MAG TPA: UDP-glucose 4-epimerase GalE, partial [Chloroflexi bacterium]|nr:UDP-glucose 4-epimerase GalE [Chloroflexota bacterium]